MATAATHPTLVDLASRLDQEGRIIPIAEVLAKRDPILKLLHWKECNKTDGYLHAIRTGIPEAAFRKLYQGVQPAKSTTAQVTDTCGNLEVYAEVDKDLADINGNSAQWRLSEQRAFFQGMGNKMAETIFYGDTDINPDRFMGIAARFNQLPTNAKAAPAAQHVIDVGGTGNDLTSIFFISLDQFFGIYPKGSKIGLQHTDKGQQTKVLEDGSMYEVYRDHYKWQAGTALEDWRGVVRIANVKISDLVGGTGSLTSDALIKMLIRAKNKIPADLATNVHMFCCEEVRTALEIAAVDKSTNAVKIVEAADQFKSLFFNIPIEVSDSISKTEKQVK